MKRPSRRALLEQIRNLKQAYDGMEEAFLANQKLLDQPCVNCVYWESKIKRMK